MSDKILGKDIPFPRGYTICASSFNPENDGEEQAAINDCKQYVYKNDFTQADVRIIKEADCILVVTRRDVFLKV